MKLNKILLLFTAFLALFSLVFPYKVLAVYSSSYAEPNILIKKGASGIGVKWVQDMLNHNGYNLVVDGAFGNNTLTAVKNFQSKYGLTVDGIVGQATRSTLKQYASSSSSSTTTSATNIKYTTANLNLRNGASTSYPIILTIPKGSSVTIISENSNGWSLIKYGTAYGFVSKSYLTATNPNITSSSNVSSSSNSYALSTFNRGATNLTTIIKNCKAYYTNNNFYYSTANGARSIPADKSVPDSLGRCYTDCSCYVSWCLYEYALANGKTNMQNYFSYQRNSATFASIGANNGNSYLSVVSKKTASSNINLAKAQPGDILVSNGHVEFFNSYTTNSNGTITLKVYNCGSTSSIQANGITTSATKQVSDITYILRVK